MALLQQCSPPERIIRMYPMAFPTEQGKTYKLHKANKNLQNSYLLLKKIIIQSHKPFRKGIPTGVMDRSNSRKIISSTLVERTQNGFYLHLPLQLDFYLPNLAPKFHSFLQSWAVSLLMVRRSKCQNFTAFLALFLMVRQSSVGM